MIYAIEYLANFIDAFAGIIFIAKFSGNSNNKRWILGVIIGFVVMTLSNYFTHNTHFSEYHVILMTLLLYCYSMWIKGSRLFTRLISPLLYMLVLIIINTLVLYAYSIFLPESFGEIVFASSLHRYIYIFLCKIAMISALIIITRLFVTRENFSLIDFFVYLVLPLGTVLTLYIFLIFGIEYDISRYSIPIITVICILFASNFVLLMLFKRSMKNAEARHELELIKSRSEMEEERYRELGNIYAQLRMTRHDIREHLMYINFLMEECKYDEVNKYISDKQSELDNAKKICYTGNRLIDFILDSRMAQNEDISFNISGSLAELESIDELDLTSLMGNILTNAIQGIEGASKKRIDIIFRVQGEYQNITCKNSIAESVLKSNPELLSSKADRSNHGIGIKSIRSTVERYDGMIEF